MVAVNPDSSFKVSFSSNFAFDLSQLQRSLRRSSSDLQKRVRAREPTTTMTMTADQINPLHIYHQTSAVSNHLGQNAVVVDSAPMPQASTRVCGASCSLRMILLANVILMIKTRVIYNVSLVCLVQNQFQFAAVTSIL